MKNRNSFQKSSFFLLIIIVLTFTATGKSQSRQYANPETRARIACGYETRKFGAAPGKPLTDINEARKILDEVLVIAGISSDSVEIYEANVGVQLAVACPPEQGKSIILFDAEKLNQIIRKGGNNLVVKSIFAHEAGHHFYNHFIKSALRADKEIEADEFAGKILAKLNADLDDVREAYKAWIGDDNIFLEKRDVDYPLPSKRLEAVERGWKSVRPVVKLRITNLVFGDATWTVTMSKLKSDPAQAFRLNSTFPQKDIKEFWDKNYYISDLSYGVSSSYNDNLFSSYNNFNLFNQNNFSLAVKTWAVVMTKGTNYTAQSYFRLKTFPADYIKEYWNKDYYITNVTYGDGIWAVVMTKRADYTAQSYFSGKSFPADKIKEYWGKDYYITNVAYGDGFWTITMTKVRDYTTQSHFSGKSFPADKIKEYWDKGYSITNIAYGDGFWIVIMTKGTDYTTQSWRKSKLFPKEEINQLWAK